MPFGRVGIGCDSLSSAALQIKSQEPSLRGKVYYPPKSPKGGQNLLARSSPEVCSAALHTHLPRARRSARLFLPCTPFVPHYGTPVTDSPKGNYYVRSRYSVLRSCRLVSASGFPASHRSLKSPLPVRLQSLRLHLQHQLVRAAGLLRFTVPGIVP